MLLDENAFPEIVWYRPNKFHITELNTQCPTLGILCEPVYTKIPRLSSIKGFKVHDVVYSYGGVLPVITQLSERRDLIIADNHSNMREHIISVPDTDLRMGIIKCKNADQLVFYLTSIRKYITKKKTD
jgi:hypothetical protein